jgi:hypothetical protein
MTVAARKVLEDCRGAIGEIVDGIQGGAWRRRWVAAVVLLRTVGYVLSAVDSQRNDAYKRSIENAWKKLNDSKPEPPIFWEFIDKERHNIVHEYEVRAGQGVTVHLGQNKPHDYHYLINAGHFKGHDQREVLREAVNWWDSYLDNIDKDATNER